MERKRKNTIFHLEYEGNILEKNILEKEEEILKHATNYYKNLFGPSKNPTFHLNQNCWEHHEKVSNEENDYLSSPFSMEELKNGPLYEKEYNPRTRSHASRILPIWMESDQE
jgi:hypothetical protein